MTAKHCRFPKSNKRYWRAKLSRNRRRDRTVIIEHDKLGWVAIRVWEHAIKARPEACVARIKAVILQRRRSPIRSPKKSAR
jgi:DNA mismatch endonuclease (patch repair protein)